MPSWVKPLLAVVLLAMLIWLALPTVKSWLAGSAADKPQSAQAAPDGAFKVTDGQWATLSFAKIDRAVFQDLRETDGRIAVDDDAATQVFSPLSGRVIKVVAKAGDRVKKGDPLLVVEGSEFVQGDNDLTAATASVASAKAQFVQADAEEKRQHQLYDEKGAALKDWQQAQTDLAAAQAAVKTAEAGLAAARNRLAILGRSDAEIAALENAGPAARHPAASTVPAPIDGTVTARSVNPGEYINSAATGGQAIYTIGDLDHLWLVANLREADAGFAHVGDKVAVTVVAYPGRVFTGIVSYVAPGVDPASRRLPLHAEIVNQDGALKPDMFATFRIISQSNAVTAPAVPESAVIREGEAARVWIADPAAKTVSLREIKAGRSQDGMIAVEGVKPGETVVTKGALFIDRAARSD
jgi:cobalt-zinc-cadmium efflux system membrane fusion protein